jgi:hypothetical protein
MTGEYARYCAKADGPGGRIAAQMLLGESMVPGPVELARVAAEDNVDSEGQGPRRDLAEEGGRRDTRGHGRRDKTTR